MADGKINASGWADVTDLPDDLAAANTRVDRATERTNGYWECLFGDDPLLTSVPGDGTGHRPDRVSVHRRWLTRRPWPTATGTKERHTNRLGELAV